MHLVNQASEQIEVALAERPQQARTPRPRIGPPIAVVGLVLLYLGFTVALSTQTSCGNDFGGVFEPSARFILAGKPLDMYQVIAGGNNPFYPNATGPVGEFFMAGALYTGRALHLQDIPAECRILDGYPLPQDSIPLHMWVILLFALVPLAIGIEIMHLLDRYQTQPFTGWQRLLAWVLILVSPPMWDSLIFYGHYEQPLALYFGLLAVRFFSERARPGERHLLPIWAKMALAGVLLGLALLCRTSASFTVIPLALVLLFDIVRNRGQRWQRLGEALIWGGALTATVVLILLPFYQYDRANLTFSLLTFRARLGIGDGSLWTFAIGTPWEAHLQALDSTVGLALAVVLSSAALLLGRVRGRNDPAIYAVIAVATICFPLSIKAVWGYYFADPLLWVLAWAATRPTLRQRWWEPIIATAFFAVMMVMTETRISVAPPGLSEIGLTRVIVLIESGSEFLGLFLVQLLFIVLVVTGGPISAKMPLSAEEISAIPQGSRHASVGSAD
jgi:hypothetical protein